MRIVFLLVTFVILLSSCGKKSDPEYQGSIKNQIENKKNKSNLKITIN